MKSDKLLKQYEQKGLKVKSANVSRLRTLKEKKHLQAIDSGQLLSVKGGSGGSGDPGRVIISN